MKKSRFYILFVTFFVFLLLLFPIFFDNACKAVNSEKNNIDFFGKKFITGFHLKFFKRRFIIYKEPNSPPPEKGFPVLFLFHGAVQHAFSWFFGFNFWSKAQTSFTRYALENGFFVVSFESLKPIRPGPRAWDAFEKNMTDNSDFLYLKNVISWLDNSSLSVDVGSIYCAGFSSGAFFCSRLSQSFDYKFKGVIINSGCNANCITLTNFGPVFNCSTGFNISSKHPPALIVHGKKDSLVPYMCAESYYQDLLDGGFEASLLADNSSGHIWLKKYNDLIIDWLKNH